MKQKKQTHLHGHRGQAFADQIRGILPEQILCVSIDISKDFHIVLIHNGLGDIVRSSFEIDIFRDGFEQLCDAVEEAKRETEACVVLVGLEPTGHYYDNLARHIHAGGQAVTIVNSYAVKQNRSQRMMDREKNDEIDAASIGDLLRRGEGTPCRPVTGIYLQLQQLDRLRMREMKIQTMYKNRIIGRLDILFPGLILTQAAKEKGYAPLFKVPFWECVTLQRLIRICPDPRHLAAMSEDELNARFHAQGYRLGRVFARRIIVYARKVLWPDPAVAAIHADLLPLELTALEQIEGRIAVLDERIEELLEGTPYQILTRVKGLSSITVGSLAGAVGDPANYKRSRQVFRFSGLVSGRDDSGIRQRQGEGQGVVKTGSVHLRRALGTMLNGLILHQPVLSSYYHKKKQTKKTGVARVATMRRATGILWATMRDQEAHTLIMRGETAM